MNHVKVMCGCGCDTEAQWLAWGIEYDPTQPNGLGRRFESPMCQHAVAYCEDTAIALGLPFDKEPLS